MATKTPCPVCGKEFGSKSALTQHAKKEHGSGELVTLVNKYGDMAPRPGGAWRPNRPLRAAPSGIPSIDYAIGIGGVPRGTILEIYGPAGCGKAMALDTPIPTPSGWTTMGALVDGDTVFDESGHPCRVLKAHPIRVNRPCYEVVFSDGTAVVADAEHLWTTQVRAGAFGVADTQTLAADSQRHFLPLHNGLICEDVDLPIDPYVLGAWLGDGDSHHALLHTNRQEAPFFREQLEAAGYQTELRLGSRSSGENARILHFRQTRVTATVPNPSGLCHCGCGEPAPVSVYSHKGTGVVRGQARRFIAGHDGHTTRAADTQSVVMEIEAPRDYVTRESLRQLGVFGDKHIPDVYLRASRRQRWALLQGLMDTDGHIRKSGGAEFITKFAALRDNMLELLRSLGFTPRVSEKWVTPCRTSKAYAYGERYGPYWRISFLPSSKAPVVRMPHKLTRLRETRRRQRSIVSIQPMESVPVRCITVDSPNSLYLAGAGMVPTHNTLTALTFSAYTQRHGGRAAYVDAEHRLQPTFAMLVPDLDLDKLEYTEPDGGEQALNMTKDYVMTGAYDIWTVDSVHGCVPKALRDKEIGDATMSELAKLMSAACQVLEPIVSETNTVVIFVNHIKSVPGVQYGRDWSKPGGSALDYYASVQLRVEPRHVFQNSEGRKIGHTVKVRVDNSKVAAPYATAHYDVFYREDKIVKSGHERDKQTVKPGIDIASCWYSVCEEAQMVVKDTTGRVVDLETGESLGYRRDVMEGLAAEESDLYKRAKELVYGTYANGAKAA